MYKYSLLLIIALLTTAWQAPAQNTDHRPRWFSAMESCRTVAWDRAGTDFKDLIDRATSQGIPVRLTIKSANFEVDTWMAKPKVSDNEVILNFYCTTLSDTSADKNNCTGVLWAGNVPLSLR